MSTAQYLMSLPLAPQPSYADRSITGTGEPRDFRTHTKQPAKFSSARLSAAGAVAGLGAISAGHRGPDAGFWYGAFFHSSPRGGKHLGNHYSGVSSTVAGYLRRPDHRPLSCAAGRSVARPRSH